MDNHEDIEAPDTPAPQPGSNSASLMYIGILFVLIIGLLAVLWTRERRLRAAAEQDVANLRQTNDILKRALGTLGAFQPPTTQPTADQHPTTNKKPPTSK